MSRVMQILLFLHYLGLALGFAVSFSNMVMGGLISKAPPSEKAVLGRFPPTMSRLGRIGLILLWVTGVALVYLKWGGFAVLSWEFYVKLAAVVFLTFTTEYIHWLERLVHKGELAAAARIEAAGKIATILALIALVFAVLAFN